jgi:uncharacterized protein (TIRG00374 family)
MILLAVIIIVVMVLQADPQDVIRKASGADLRIIAAVIGLYLLNTLAKTIRWYALLTGDSYRVPFGKVALFFLVGLSINNTTPGRIAGEPIRAYLLKTGTGYPMGRGMATIFLEKTIDTIVTILLAITGIVLLVRVIPRTATISLALSAGIIALFMGGLILLVAYPSGPRRVSSWIFGKLRGRRSSERVANMEATVDGFLGTFEKGTRDIVHDRSRTAAATGLTVVIWLNEALRLWLIFLALGYNISAELMLIATTLASFAALLIPLGAGNSAAMVVICGLAGVDTDLATTASLVFIMTSIWLSVPLGAVAMAVLGVKVKDVLTRNVTLELSGGGRVEPETGPDGDTKPLDVPDQQSVPNVPDPP